MGAILELTEVRARVHRLTVEDYIKLAEENPAYRHAEMIRGIIVEKMPKSPLHVTLTTRIYLLLLRMLRLEFVVRKEDPLRLQDSMPEPDVSVVRGTLEDFRTRHPTTAELVVEVAVSSVAPDRENASLYAEASVTEYWIVLGEKEQVEVYRRPVEGVYLERRTYTRGEVIEGVGVTAQAVPVDALFA